MADIYVHLEEGTETLFPEEQIPDLLQQGTLTPETYYWREGMARWRPLSTFKPAVQAIVPERRSGVLPELINRPRRELPGITERDSGSARRFRFRRRPEIVTWVVAVILAALLLVTFAELAYAAAGVDSGLGSRLPGGAASRDQLVLWLGWTGLGLNALLLIPYCLWVYRAALNNANFSSTTRFKPGWVVGCHFVPGINLILPLQAMQEIWKVSGNPRGWQNDTASILVGGWWAFFLLTLGLTGVCLTTSGGTQNPDDLKTALLVFVGLKVVQLIWYALFFALITQVLRRQLRLVRPAATAPRPAL